MIIGHKKILNILNKSIEKGRVNHAYLFHGPEKVGKFSVALEFCQKLTGEAGQINPDIIIVKPEIEEKKGIIKQKDITVEKIKDLGRQIALSSYFGKYKTVIIDEADRLNRSAQNALLKILEEPPEKAILILVAKNKEKLLPTIISRCQRVRFNLVGNNDAEKMIPAGAKNKEELLFWFMGRPGMMQEFLSDPAKLKAFKESESELRKIFSQNASDKFALAQELAKDEGQLLEKLNLWIFLLRSWLLSGENSISKEKIISLLDKIFAAMDTLRETNSSTKLAMENLLLDF